MSKQSETMGPVILTAWSWYASFSLWTSSYEHIPISQGELEHRTLKSQYHRTDQREYVKQMTQIEHQEARIRHIRMKTFGKDEESTSYEQVALNPHIHHCIRQSENFYEHIGLNFTECSGDSAVRVKVH
jgi:hypothetical protein